MGNQQTVLTKRSIDIPSGRISYTEAGSGPVALFVHGVVLNIPNMQAGFVAKLAWTCMVVFLGLVFSDLASSSELGLDRLKRSLASELIANTVNMRAGHRVLEIDEHSIDYVGNSLVTFGGKLDQSSLPLSGLVSGKARIDFKYPKLSDGRWCVKVTMNTVSLESSSALQDDQVLINDQGRFIVECPLEDGEQSHDWYLTP